MNLFEYTERGMRAERGGGEMEGRKGVVQRKGAKVRWRAAAFGGCVSLAVCFWFLVFFGVFLVTVVELGTEVWVG